MNWSMVQLQDLARPEKGSIVSGPFGSNIGSRFFVEEGIPVIRGNNLTVGRERFVDDGFVFLTEEKASEFKNCEAIKDDIIFTAAGTIGQVGLIPENTKFEKYIISNKQLRVRIDTSKANPVFVYYWLTTREMNRHIIGLNNGGAVPLINLSIIRKLPVPLPPYEKQEKIVSIVSTYDSLIENNRRRIQLLEQSARLLYREWFVYLRFPGHEHVRIIDGVPEEWEMKRLEDVCLRITDGSHWSPKTVDDGYPMASVKDMNEWGFEISECRKISEEDYEELIRNDCKPLKGDVLIAKDGSYLKHIFVIEKEIDLVILSSIAIIRPNNQILSHVLSLYLREPSVKNRMAGYVSGVALPRIVLKDFRKFLVMVPDMYLQKQFFNIAEPMIKNCHFLIEMSPYQT